MSNELSLSAVKRIGSDVKDILNNPIDNCLYIHSSIRVDEGYAVIFGADDTPYFGVPMFFKLNFPCDYPHQPPKMKFLSYSSPNATNIRMHPNYYTSGKCCLSILNTWSGNKWTGCQTIRSLLLSISITLTKDPIENEPGFNNSCEPFYRPIVVNAGMHLLNNYLKNYKMISFSNDDEENSNLQERFYYYITKTYLNNNSEMLIKNLKDENSFVNKWFSCIPTTKHKKPLKVSVYSLYEKVDFEKTKNSIIPILELIQKEKEK